MKKSSVIALLLVFAMVAATVCAAFVFVQADTDDTHTFWLTHYDDGFSEGAGVVFTDADSAGGWWLHVAFKPVAGVADTYEITEITNGIADGKATTVTKPEGGFVYGINVGNDYSKGGTEEGTNFTSTNCNEAVAYAQTWKVGDQFTITGLDLTNKTVPTTTSDKKWYDPEYVCTATIKPYTPPAPPATVTWKALYGEVELHGENNKIENLGNGDRQLEATDWHNNFEFVGFKNMQTKSIVVEIDLDFGEAKPIGSVYMDFFRDNAEGTGSNIYMPNSVVVEVSTDGENYYNVSGGDENIAVTEGENLKVNTVTVDFSTRASINARYVRVTVSTDKRYFFLTEIGVTDGKADATPINTSDGFEYNTENETNSYGIAVFDQPGDYDLSSAEDPKSFKGCMVTIGTWDETAKAYKIRFNKVNPWPDGHNETVTLAEGEIMVAIQSQGDLSKESAADVYGSQVKWIMRGAKVGDYIVLDKDAKTFKLVPPEAKILYNLLGELKKTDTSDYTITVNSDSSVTVTLKRDASQGNGIVIADNIGAKVDLSHAGVYYVGDYTSTYTEGNGPEFRIHYGRVKGGTPGVGDLYSTNEGVVNSGKKASWFNWDFGAYVSGSSYNVEGGNEIKDLAITAGKAGDTYTFRTLAFVNADNMMTVGTPLVTRDDLPRNIALNKTYTGAEPYQGKYNAPLTDGVASDALSYDNQWFGFYCNASATEMNAPNHVGTLVIDLGTVSTIQSVRVNTYVGPSTSGITAPDSVKAEYSVDGLTYTQIGTTLKPTANNDDQVQWLGFDSGYNVLGRYVKLTVGVPGTFVFLNEVEVIGLPYAEEAVEVDGDLNDTGYVDANWVTNNYLQTEAAADVTPKDLAGTFTVRMDKNKVYYAIQIDNTIAPNITKKYADDIAAKSGVLTANGAQTDTYNQTGATSFRIWLRTNNEKRYLVDVQYLGEELGWVATRAIFLADSGKTWDDLKVSEKDGNIAVKYDYTTRTLTAEIALDKATWGIEDTIGTFVSFNENYDGANNQYLHITSEISPDATFDEKGTKLLSNGYLTQGYSGDPHTIPYVWFNGTIGDVTYADYAAVTEAIVNASLLSEANYTADSWKVLQDAINAVDYTKHADEQAAVDAMAKAITDAVNALEYKGANYDAVNDAKAKAALLVESNYTPESWKVLQDALAAVVDGKKANEQAEVDAMAQAILDAIDALVKVQDAPIGDANYTAVNEMKRIAEALNESDYTPESWKVLQDALAAVVDGKKANEQAEVDAMAKAIADAIIGLVPVEPTTPDTSDTSSDTSDTSSDTSDTSSDTSDTSSDTSDTSSDTSDTSSDTSDTSSDTSDTSSDTSDTSSDTSDTSSDTSDTSSDTSDTSSDASSATSSAASSSTGSSSAASSSAASSDSPHTGDSGIVIFAVLAVLSLAGTIVAVRIRH